MSEIDNQKEINQFLDLISNIRSGNIPISVYSKKIRKKNVPSDIQLVYGKNPQLALCILAKCEYLNKCWDMQNFKWKNPDNHSCINNDLWIKFSSKKQGIKSYKSLGEISFSQFELTLIIGILQDYYHKTNNSQIKEILSKLVECSSLKGIMVKREYL